MIDSFTQGKAWDGAPKRATSIPNASHQNLPRSCKEPVNFCLDTWIDHLGRTTALRARHAWRSPKQAADQWALGIHGTPLRSKMRTRQIFQRSCMHGLAQPRQARHFFAGRRDRAAAIMAARFASKGWNPLAQKTNDLTVIVHDNQGARNKNERGL